MDYVSLAITIIAAIITIFSFYSGKKLKKLILSEKDMMQDKIADFKTTLKRYIDIVNNDRATSGDNTRNTVNIRIEEIEGIVRNLNRFENRLKDIK